MAVVLNSKLNTDIFCRSQITKPYRVTFCFQLTTNLSLINMIYMSNGAVQFGWKLEAGCQTILSEYLDEWVHANIFCHFLQGRTTFVTS